MVPEDTKKETKTGDIKTKEKGIKIDLEEIKETETKDPSKHHNKKSLPSIIESTWEKTLEEIEEERKKK